MNELLYLYYIFNFYLKGEGTVRVSFNILYLWTIQLTIFELMDGTIGY